MTKIFIIAGEPSGDVLGGKLISAIKKNAERKNIQFIGVGGSKMQDEGLESIFPMSELSIMGIAEVLPHLPKLIQRINQTAAAIINSEADMVITIDSPDFCFRVIKKLKKDPFFSKTKKVHMIAPSVWAYRPGRAEKISKLYDLLIAILPFEPPYFEKHGLETLFIGHPIVEGFKEISENNFRQKYNIKDSDLLITTTPGSRVGEVKRILPDIIGAVNILSQRHPNLIIAIPVIEKVRPIVEENLKLIKARVILIKQDEKYHAFASSNLAIAKSGTNNLEISSAKTPLITIYKINPLTHFIIKRLIKIKFANIINLILNKELIPELIQDNCTAQKIADAAENLISDFEARENQVNQAQNVLKILGLNSDNLPSDKAAKKILSYF